MPDSSRFPCFAGMPISTDPARILIVHLGPPADLCRGVSLAVSLRQKYPQAGIDWLTQQSLVPLVAAHRDVDAVIELPDQTTETAVGWRRGWGRATGVRDVLRRLRAGAYDLCIDACGHGGSGRFARATRAATRIGPHDAGMIERMNYTIRAAPVSGTHRADRLFALLDPVDVKPVPDTQLAVRAEDAMWWMKRARTLGIDAAEAPHAVIAPGSRRPSKRWPIERWAELVAPLLHRGFERIIMIGAAWERECLQPLGEAATAANQDGEGPIIDLVGETTIGQMMAVIDAAGLVIANDTAPLHIAAGLQRPCVGLFGPTDPNVTGPLGRPEAALRTFVPRPGELIDSDDPKLGDTLMRVISTVAVIQKIDQMLWEARAAAPSRPVPHDMPAGERGRS